MPNPKLQPVSRASHADDLVAARLEHVGGLEEDRLALAGAGLRPCAERGGGGLDRVPGVLAAAGGDVGDHVARVRVEVLERAAVGGVRPTSLR